MDSSLENSMFVNRVWVQCENESCLKWRLLSSEAAATIDHDEPWYCFMNTDSTFNNCSISEEDFPEEFQFNESGYKFVYSLLPLGSLVLVKLQNWPSWPGILCLDPFKRKYVTYDLDGNVKQYHIEFLGDPHSRAWINATFVGYYSVTLKPGECRSRKKWYKSALEEACLLYDYSPQQRLEACCQSKQDSTKVAVVAKKRCTRVVTQVSKNNIKKKPKFIKRKSEAALKRSVENICSHEALLTETMVVSETEDLLKELEKMLQQAQEPAGAPDESEKEHGEETCAGEKLSQHSPEVPAGSPFQSYNEEDCLVIDGERLEAGECIESITNKFKEIDALMSEF
ncbi:zinc finger CW-type PWWP domain protein 2 [Nannospalax galili]|uniref:zinc finger CW-type PWWP domain protein 2 n=1 Tax=Nannospalax galili TaxID=1026970 RepID=UPI00111BD1F1|nr:zinc finger CW-type PWWP domain protein 2 [Nannospalax galili]